MGRFFYYMKINFVENTDGIRTYVSSISEVLLCFSGCCQLFFYWNHCDLSSSALKTLTIVSSLLFKSVMNRYFLRLLFFFLSFSYQTLLSVSDLLFHPRRSWAASRSAGWPLTLTTWSVSFLSRVWWMRASSLHPSSGPTVSPAVTSLQRMSCMCLA